MLYLCPDFLHQEPVENLLSSSYFIPLGCLLQNTTIDPNTCQYNEYVNAVTLNPTYPTYGSADSVNVIPPNVSPANYLPPLGSGLQLENLQQPDKRQNK